MTCNVRIVGGLVFALGAGAAGCRVEEGVRHEVVAKAPAAAVPSGSLPAGHPTAPGAAVPPPGMAGAVPPPPTVAAGAGLKWTLPPGWTETRPGGMRFATLKPPGDAPVEVSVVVLAGDAGGELANVNRWRGQLGLPTIDAAGLAAARSPVETKAGPAAVFDFTAEGAKPSRLVAALVAKDGSTWFLKLTGEAGAVGEARAAFGAIVASLAF